METLELVVYTVLALIAGGLIASVTIDAGNVRKKNGEDTIRYSKEEFITHIPQVWKECGLGSYDKDYNFYVYGAGNLTDEDILGYIVKFNFDSVLPEKDLNITNCALPNIITVSCSSGKLVIRGQ